MAKKNLFPSLLLTINPLKFQELTAFIDEMIAKYQLNIVNKQNIKYESIKNLYRESHALVYPSLVESLGLPLVEASNLSLPIIASERDYVRDIVDPIESFDPESPTSIAKALLRHMKKNEKRNIKALFSPNAFIKDILN